MPAILIVDDDVNIRELISALLKKEGFQTYQSSDGNAALEELAKRKIDLCVLDIMMPRMNGFEFCKSAKEFYIDLPILMLSAKNKTDDKVLGLNIGSDDYLAKPFEPSELIARVKTLLRRYKIATEKIIKIGALTLDANSWTASLDGKNIDIALKEFELLFKLASQAGKTLSRSVLLEEIWGFDFDGNERTLDVHISRLRERFNAKTAKFEIITIRGLGYRLEEKK
ncbi:MAG: response regulator transcription factor [Elusimicrobiota bacterium]|jgi:DNA-binding response OmpR family regulator|nr:response regulator transcription factor [Elusimicrobiota bacterium]